MTATTYAVDDAGWFVRVPLAPGQRPGEVPLAAGWRLATAAEVDDEQTLRARRVMHGATADAEADAAPVYRLAADLAERRPFRLDLADLIALNVAAIGRVAHQVKGGSVYPIVLPDAAKRCGKVDVAEELAATLANVAELVAAGRYLAAAAFIGWRLSWHHPFPDGNGRSSRAAAYAVLLAGSPELRAAHALRSGSVGRAHLLVPERIERSRGRYLDVMNAAHADSASAPPGYRRFVDLTRIESYLATLAADQIADRPSLEDSPLPCDACAARSQEGTP